MAALIDREGNRDDADEQDTARAAKVAVLQQDAKPALLLGSMR
jgi:hypothetical protein